MFKIGAQLLHFSHEILEIYKIFTFVWTVACVAAHVNQKIGACSTAISTAITMMGPFIRMLHTMSKHKVESITCVFTCMEDLCIRLFIHQHNIREGQRQLPKQVLRYSEMMNITKYPLINFPKITAESTEHFFFFVLNRYYIRHVKQKLV
jgi:hypothetical protein